MSAVPAAPASGLLAPTLEHKSFVIPDALLDDDMEAMENAKELIAQMLDYIVTVLEKSGRSNDEDGRAARGQRDGWWT